MISVPIISDPSWKLLADKIASFGCTTMVIGRVDTGKSTFCRYLASVMLEKGLKTAIVDSDVGQSWIGPPTTVGMKQIREDPIRTLFPDSFYFVGSISPERHLLETTVGVKRMVEAANTAGAERIIIDTTGLVGGGVGRALKSGKIELVRPDHIVCFQRGNELEKLIRGFEPGYRIHRLEPSRGVEKKSQNARRTYRQIQFEKYFAQCSSQEFPFSKLHGQRTIFLNGRQANSKELKNISDVVDDEVLYAEWSFKGLFVVTVDKLSELAARKLRSHLSLDELSTHTPEDFQQLVVALIDKHGEPICLALIEKLDFGQKILIMKCKKNIAEHTKMLQFGKFHLGG